MSDAKDVDFDYVEVHVARKIEIRLSPGELLDAARHPISTAAGAAAKAADGAGRLKRLAGQIKSYVVGGPKPPTDEG